MLCCFLSNLLDPYAQTQREQLTLLHLAVHHVPHEGGESDYQEMIKYLVTIVEDVNCKDKRDEATALHFAIQRQNRPAVKVLLEESPNIDMNVKDRSSRTPLHYAVQHKTDDMTRLLLEK